jgi:hypothetical protein
MTQAYGNNSLNRHLKKTLQSPCAYPPLGSRETKDTKPGSVHSFLDFNLQVPANAALFYVLCAIAAANPLQESQRRRVRRRVQSEVASDEAVS